MSDAILRWNTWATEWFKGALPTHTWNYPQLLPANWSISYQFMRNQHIELFAKLTIFLFPLGLIFIFLDSFFRTKQFGYILGLITCMFLTKLTPSYNLFGGYADTACAFMAFTVIYLLTVQNEKNPRFKTTFILTIFIGAGAALTKQAGIYICCLIPLLQYLFLLKNRYDITAIQKVYLMLFSIILLIALTLPSYFFAHLPPAMKGYNPQNILLSALPYYRLTLIQRTIYGVHLLTTLMGTFLVIITCLFLILSLLLNTFARLITSLIIIPYFLIWLLFYSYDPRNVTLILPFIGLSIGFTIECIFMNLSARLIKICILSFSILSIGLLLINSQRIDRALERSQTLAKINYNGLTNFNRIYLYKHLSNTKGMIVSNYIFLKHLPLFTKRAIDVTYLDIPKLITILQTYKPIKIIINKYSLALYIQNALEKQSNAPVTPQNAMQLNYEMVNQKQVKKYKVNEYIQNNILNNHYIKKHYKVDFNHPVIIFMSQRK